MACLAIRTYKIVLILPHFVWWPLKATAALEKGTYDLALGSKFKCLATSLGLWGLPPSTVSDTRLLRNKVNVGSLVRPGDHTIPLTMAGICWTTMAKNGAWFTSQPPCLAMEILAPTVFVSWGLPAWCIGTVTVSRTAFKIRRYDGRVSCFHRPYF